MEQLVKRVKKLAKSSPIFLIIFITIPILTIGVGFLKLATGNAQYVYVKLKVSPGLWWAYSERPNYWLAEGIKKGDKEINLLGKETAEILSVRYYPYYQTEDKYDVYITAKLKADYNKQRDEYSYGRSPLVIGSPVEISLESAQLTGSLMEFSKEEPDNNYEEKTIYITKKFSHPWEYGAIKAGDKYFDGEEVVFEVISKNQVATEVIAPDYFGNFLPKTTERNRFITVKAKAKLRQKDGVYFFGEENLANAGSKITISTPNFYYYDFFVSKIEDNQ